MFRIAPPWPLIFFLWRVYQNKRQTRTGLFFTFATNRQMENILWEVWYFDTNTGFAKQTALNPFYMSLSSSLK